MSKIKLHISDDFSLPPEALTQTFAVLAKRGVGKTYTTLVIVEEFLSAGLPVVVVDPVGVCWGLRVGADGKSPGLQIIIFGGERGDVPLEPTGGALVADLVVDQRLSAVLDLSLLRKGEQVRFMTDFAERLYHRNRNPLHLVLDEADAFAPQRPLKGQERMLGAVEDIVRRGRARGLGVTLVTQRSAVLNKDVLTQIEVLIALRTIAPQDRDAIDAWVKVHGTAEERGEIMKTLPSLPIGTAWFWSPGWLDVFRKIAVRKRITFDSSATPDVSKQAITPKRFADVDIEVLKGKMAETLEKAKSDDPKELRKRIAELEGELRKVQAAGPKVETKEVPVFTDGDRAGLAVLAETIDNKVFHSIKSLTDKLEEIKGLLAPILFKAQEAVRPRPLQHSIPAPRPSRAPRSTPPSLEGGGTAKLPAGERKILTVLAQYPLGRTKVQIAILTGYAHSGGSFNNYLSALRSKGFIEGRESLSITDAGLETLGPCEALPMGEELLNYWLGQLGRAEGLILRALVEAYPKAMTKEEVAMRTTYEASGGGFNNALSRLRTLELIEGRGELKASEVLFG